MGSVALVIQFEWHKGEKARVGDKCFEGIKINVTDMSTEIKIYINTDASVLMESIYRHSVTHAYDWNSY